VWSAKILIPIFVVSFSGNTTRAATATDATTPRSIRIRVPDSP
jgi:hypothetical protein